MVAKDKPPTPPSISACKKEVRLDFKKELKGLSQNKNYLFLSVCYTMIYATVNSTGAIISSLTEPYGYTGKDNSIFGGVFIISGILGSIVCGIVIDRYQRYRMLVILIGSFSFFFTVLSFFTLPSGSLPLFTLNQILLGFASVPMNSVGFSYSVELTYPAPESMSNGMMILIAKIYGVLITLASGTLASYSPRYAVTLFAVNNFIAGVASFFIIEDLRRLRPKKQIQKSLENEEHQLEQIIE